MSLGLIYTCKQWLVSTEVVRVMYLDINVSRVTSVVVRLFSLLSAGASDLIHPYSNLLRTRNWFFWETTNYSS